MRVDRSSESVADTLQQAMDRFHALVRSRSLRMGHVRTTVARAAMTRDGHFDVEDLLRDLSAQGIRASRATIYRALPLLVEAGLVRPTVLSGDRKQYEATFGHEHHDHLICNRCGKIVEFRFEPLETLQRELAARHGFEIEAHVHELIGVCGDCRARADDAMQSSERPHPATTGGG